MLGGEAAAQQNIFFLSNMSALKKGHSEARPRANFRTRGRVRELFSVESNINLAKRIEASERYVAKG